MAQETVAGVRPSETETTETLRSPFCRELRSKKYYFLQTMPTEEAQLLDGSNYCWCRRTMQALGPDGNLAHPQECGPNRACYQSLFEE